jgi:hypothetical protein
MGFVAIIRSRQPSQIRWTRRPVSTSVDIDASGLVITSHPPREECAAVAERRGERLYVGALQLLGQVMAPDRASRPDLLERAGQNPAIRPGVLPLSGLPERRP